MTDQPRKRAHVLLPALALVVLVACNRDTEEAFRAEVGAWLALGATRHFNTTSSCTAGVFEVRSGILNSTMRSVTSWREAKLTLDNLRPVAFENVSLTPSDFTGIIMDEEPTLGSQIISAGLAIRDCVDEDTRAAYHGALTQRDATLMFDPETQTVGILQADRTLVFVGRGDPR